jgi:hypothetical protein
MCDDESMQTRMVPASAPLPILPPSSFTLPALLQQPPPPTPFREPALERYAALTATIQTQAAELSRGIAFSSIGKARPLEPTNKQVAALEQRIGYCFSNPDIRYAHESRVGWVCSLFR